jgi:ferredoxin
VADTEMNENLEYWLEFNTKYSKEWPNITQSIQQLADADAWNGKEDKGKFVSTKPGPEE